MKIPKLSAQKVSEVFVENNSSLFSDVDFNLSAWLPKSFEGTNEVEIKARILEKPLNNEQLVKSLGGQKQIKERYLFTPQQIRYLIENTETLLTNGFSNLFFVYNKETNELYLVGVVFNQEKAKWTPYIYRLYNLYRSWSAGNQVFYFEN